MAKSQFSKALGRELGKNTGKLISNKLFGDGHATPYRITAKVQSAQLRADSKIAEANALVDAERAKANAIKHQADLEFEKEKLKIKFEKEKEDGLLLNDIANVNFSNNKEEVAHSIGSLISLAESHNTKNIRKAALSKAESGILRLVQLSGTTDAVYYENKIKSIKKKELYPLFISVAGILIVIIGFGLGAITKTEEIFGRMEEFHPYRKEKDIVIIFGVAGIIFGIYKYFKK